MSDRGVFRASEASGGIDCPKGEASISWWPEGSPVSTFDLNSFASSDPRGASSLLQAPNGVPRAPTLA